MKWTVVTQSDDGSLSVAGPFDDEQAATLYGNEQETPESGCICHVLPLVTP
jgi:hypothetical protein